MPEAPLPTLLPGIIMTVSSRLSYTTCILLSFWTAVVLCQQTKVDVYADGACGSTGVKVTALVDDGNCTQLNAVIGDTYPLSIRLTYLTLGCAGDLCSTGL